MEAPNAFSNANTVRGEKRDLSKGTMGKKNLKKSQNGIFAAQQKRGFECIWITDLICHQPIFISCSIVQHSLGITTAACVSRGSSQLNLYLSIHSMPVHPPHSIFNAFSVSFLFPNCIISVLRVTCWETNTAAITNAYLVPVLLFIFSKWLLDLISQEHGADIQMSSFIKNQY